MDPSTPELLKIAKDYLGWLVAMATGGFNFWQRRQDRNSREGQRAAQLAARLERYAHERHAQVLRNDAARPDAGRFDFDLPALAPAATIGSRRIDLRLYQRYIDLQSDITHASEAVRDTDRGSWDDYAGLDTLETRSYRIASQALNLAHDYLASRAMRRTPMAPRERGIERYIHDRAIAVSSPAATNLPGKLRVVLARRRIGRLAWVRDQRLARGLSVDTSARRGIAGWWQGIVRRRGRRATGRDGNDAT